MKVITTISLFIVFAAAMPASPTGDKGLTIVTKPEPPKISKPFYLELISHDNNINGALLETCLVDTHLQVPCIKSDDEVDDNDDSDDEQTGEDAQEFFMAWREDPPFDKFKLSKDRGQLIWTIADGSADTFYASAWLSPNTTYPFVSIPALFHEQQTEAVLMQIDERGLLNVNGAQN